MNAAEKKALFAIPFVILIGFGFAWAGSGGQPWQDGLHPFALAVLVAFALQWLAFIPAYRYQTEKYFDLVGSLSYVTVALIAYFASEAQNARSLLLLVLVLAWALRLGSFLFKRILKAGKDGRFDEMKPSFIRFGAAWTLQGLWVTFTAGAALAAMTAKAQPGLDLYTTIGGLLWLIGFGFEAIADWQKSRFRADSANGGDFIATGLWARSRHPNYFGEIVLWLGVAVIAFPALQGWQLLTLLSPILVALLLCKVSGIPLLEERSDQKWGGNADYEAYKKKTPVLIPKLFG